MAIKTEKDLTERERALWLKAVAAVELGNFGYAISLLRGALKHEPEFLTGRQMLRRAEVIQHNAQKKRFLNLSTTRVELLKAQRALKKNPQLAAELAEKVLESEPYNKPANLLLKTAAVSAGWLETAVFAIETLLDESPRDVKLLHELGRLLQQLGDNERAVEVYSRICAIDPSDGAALRLGKEAAARASMKGGGWATAQSYRDLIKDKEAAISLEQATRMQLTGEELERHISEIYALHQTEPANVDYLRRLGMLNEQKEDFEAAIEWYRRASQAMAGGDLALARRISDLRIRQLDRRIADMEEFALRNSKDVTPEQTAALIEAKRQRAEMLISDARGRVERNPADLQLRFELGEHLMNAGNHREAVPELQRARQNPGVRLKAMNALGCCYRKLGMLDLAAKQLEEAGREILAMDAMKKEIIYNLGMVYEEAAEREKSLACMKQIYEVDYGYRDVAKRVESSYLGNV